MWNTEGGDQSFQGEGGFDNDFASPSQQPEKASKPKCLAAVTVKQVLECSEDGLKIRDKEVQIVQVVGIVKSVDVTSIKIKFVIEDFTGSITGFLYIDNETDSTCPVIENTYCVVTGSVRSQAGVKHIMIFNIKPLEDFRQIMEHVLTVVYMPLKLDSLSVARVGDEPMKQEMMSSYGTMDTDFGNDIDPKYRKVFEVISKSMSENGMNIAQIQCALPTKVPIDHIRAALDFLVGEGHIFTTIDENHYKSIHSAY